LYGNTERKQHAKSELIGPEDVSDRIATAFLDLIAKANPKRVAVRSTTRTRLIRVDIDCRLRNDTFAPQFPTRDKAEHTSQAF